MNVIRDGVVAAVNLIIEALGAAMNATIEAWPIEMPELPSAPTELGTAFAWIKWTPLPVDAGFAFLMFVVAVWIAWMVIAPILRWTKLID